MAAIGSVWDAGTWTDDIWADGTWGEAVSPTPPVNPSFAGGGGGGRQRYQIIYPHTKRRGKTIDQKIGDWVEAIVAGVAEETPEITQIRKIVQPYIHKDTIDLAEMQRDARQIRVLLQAYEANVRRMLDEEDDELLMMIL